MKSQVLLIVSVAILFSFGLLMIFNTTSAEIIDRSLEASTHGALIKQGLYALGGVFVGSLIYRWGHEKLIRYSYPLLALSAVFLILVFIPGIGQTVNGSRRWISLFGYTFQPSESIKILMPAAYIRWVLGREEEVSFRAFLKMLSLLSLPIALILFEPDNGTTLILLSVLVVLFFLSKIRLVYWALPLSILTVIGAVGAYQLPYVRGRIEVYLHPELDLKGKGHQPHQAKIAAGSGQLFGRGLGESLQKLNYLPEARNDYIAAIFAEETGFLGILGMIGLYALFTFSGMVIAVRSQSAQAFLLGAVLTYLISIQAFLNLGIVSGLLPSKGMTLPFFSQGGTSLIVNIIALFLLLDIARKGERHAEKA